MNFRPKSSNSETFKLLIFDLYLQCQKNGGLINGTELKDKFRLYKFEHLSFGEAVECINSLDNLIKKIQ